METITRLTDEVVIESTPGTKTEQAHNTNKL